MAMLPGGVEAIGVLCTIHSNGCSSNGNGNDNGDDDLDTEQAEAAAIARRARRSVDPATAAFVLVYGIASQRLHLFDVEDPTTPVPTDLTVIDALHTSEYLAETGHVLVRSSIDLVASSQSARDDLAMLWQEELSRPSGVYFRFPEARETVFDGLGRDLTTNSTMNLSSLIKLPETKSAKAEAAKSQKKKKKKNAMYVNDAWDGATPSSSAKSEELDRKWYLKSLEYGDIPQVEVLQSLSRRRVAREPMTPYLQIPHATVGEQGEFHVRCDVMVIVPVESSSDAVLEIIRAKLMNQLTDKLSSPTHYALDGMAFPVTVDAATSLGPRDLSTMLFQRQGQPRFDPSQCSLVTQSRALVEDVVLFNVHEGIPSSGVTGGTQYLVDGFYGYYHYMQQEMNDKGWGCAYRSLQTLASWLFLNHYTPQKTPTHREIQETLVKIGDKPSTFVGSREWIGSVEVGYVLDERYGITFRSIYVSSGHELVDKAQELKHHFETQGTPVMMGGGSLAFTLLGIDYNESSGDCAFLILDPHYVGSEDLETIQTKTMALEGYKAVPCGWRKATTFAKSFYNLCLPQRP